MRFWRTLLFAAAAACLPFWVKFAAVASDSGNWRSVAIVRFGDIDAMDSEDSPLAEFLKGIRSDGLFPPPMKTLVGPAIRNPTFYGFIFGAWMEIAVLARSLPGPLAAVWVFPVDNRDEYIGQLINQGLSEYEEMGGATVFRETDPGGNAGTWYLEWLPGEVAFFGSDRSAVGAARQIYAENSAARGLLTGRARSYIEPDLAVRLDLSQLAAWQDNEPGRYWWRDRVGRLTRDLVAFWQPGPARVRLINAMAEELTVWFQRREPLDVNFWFEESGVEWTLETAGDGMTQPALSQLDVARRLPEQTAFAYAVPVTPASFRGLGETAGRLLLGGAGGAVTAEAGSDALLLFDALSRANPGQLALAWVPPPPDSPELGGTRLLVGEWERPEHLDSAWELFKEHCRPDTPVSHALAQLGWEISVTGENGAEGTVGIGIRPVTGALDAWYYKAGIAVQRNGSWVSLAVGPEHVDAAMNRRLRNHRMDVARNAANGNGDGASAVRGAFTRMGPRGASFLGILDPVKFAQLSLVEMADWRPRSPDQRDSSFTQYAREMLEYDSGGAWTMVGEQDGRLWRCNGEIGWRSLSRLAGALGITESMGSD